MITEFFSQPIWQKIGLTLIHFLWQALAIAIITAAAVKTFNIKQGRSRYNTYLVAFAIMSLSPIITFNTIKPAINQTTTINKTESNIYTNETTPHAQHIHQTKNSTTTQLTTTPTPPIHKKLTSYLNLSMPWLILLWLTTVIILSTRLLMGLVTIFRWRNHLLPLPQNLTAKINTITKKLSMPSFKNIFLSSKITEAMAVGYLRPMILLPASMITEISPQMLQAVIAHELAHIRRFDLWINLAQRVLETLFFYHPALWWLSNSMRTEREICCDELAITATNDRITYASTLESLTRQKLQQNSPALATALSTNNKPTLNRIRHILGLSPINKNCPFWLAGLITAACLISLTIPTALALTTKQDKTPTKQTTAQRTLTFPENSVGTIYIRDIAPDNRFKAWQEHSPAKGQVTIPANKQVRLSINNSASADLSFLINLKPDDIQKLDYLRLGDQKLTNKSMRHIAKLTSLRHLTLWGAGIDKEDLAHLKNLRNLITLALDNCNITDAGLVYLKNMTNLESLQLSNTNITDTGLSNITHLTKLKTLSIHENKITDTGIEKIRPLKRLEVIWLTNTPITNNSLAVISDMKNIKQLYLLSTNITDAGLIHLRKLNNLQHILITDIGDEGVMQLSYTDLKFLQISNAKITEQSIPHFKKMQSLKRLLLSGDKVNPSLIESIQKVLPNCKVWDPQRSTNYTPPKWLEKFEQVYHLEENEIMKRIAPPFIPERKEYYLAKEPIQAAEISRPPDYFTFHWTGKLKKGGYGFGKKIAGLDSTLRRVIGLTSFEYQVSDELLDIKLPGDWIIREDATQAEKLKALQQIIAKELGRNIKIERRTIEESNTIVVSGDFKLNPIPQADDQKIILYTGTLYPKSGGGGGTVDTVTDFILKLGDLVNMPILDETTPSDANNIRYEHQTSSYLRKMKDPSKKMSKLKELLKNLSKQTNLKYNIETYPVKIWYISEK